MNDLRNRVVVDGGWMNRWDRFDCAGMISLRPLGSLHLRNSFTDAIFLRWSRSVKRPQSQLEEDSTPQIHKIHGGILTGFSRVARLNQPGGHQEQERHIPVQTEQES